MIAANKFQGRREKNERVNLIGKQASAETESRLKSILSVNFGDLNSYENWDGTVGVPIVDISEDERLKLETVLRGIVTSYDAKDTFMASIGRSSVEVLEARESEGKFFVKAVAKPSAADLGDLPRKLRDNDIRAIIRGGGTGVVGGFKRDSGRLTVALDMSNLDSISIDGYTVRCGPGVKGLDLENFLNLKQLTCGHFPESMPDSTVGGWVSTMASGQESNFYGDIESIVLGVDLYRSDFHLKDSGLPRESTGISGKSLALGGEGRTGIIGEVTLKASPLPGKRYYSSYFFRHFRDGIEFLSSTGTHPAVVRLSDETETRFMFGLAPESTGKKILRSWLNFRGSGRDSGSLMIVISNDHKSWKRIPSGIRTGPRIARQWEKERFGRPEIGNSLWRMGLVPDTIETSAEWGNLHGLYESTVKEFYRKCHSLGVRGIIMAHLSHLYRTGAAIYFTFVLGPAKSIRSGDLLELRKSLAGGFVEHGGSLSHHHGIGTDFTSLLPEGKLSLNRLVSDPVFGFQ